MCGTACDLYELVQVRFPVAIGEFGSKFEDPEDVQAMRDLALYLGKPFL